MLSHQFLTSLIFPISYDPLHHVHCLFTAHLDWNLEFFPESILDLDMQLSMLVRTDGRGRS